MRFLVVEDDADVARTPYWLLATERNDRVVARREGVRPPTHHPTPETPPAA